MASSDLVALVELTDAELELVTGGQRPDFSQRQEGLVNVAVGDVTVNAAVVALNAAPVLIGQED